MTNIGLDRLLELWKKKIETERPLPPEEWTEFQDKKSQIESKLAQADNPSWCPICQGRGFVPEGFYSTTTGQWSSTSTLTEKCRSCNGLGIIQNSNQQELSQLRPIVQALRDEKKDLEYQMTCYEIKSIPWQARKFMLDRIESILASSEVKQ